MSSRSIVATRYGFRLRLSKEMLKSSICSKQISAYHEIYKKGPTSNHQVKSLNISHDRANPHIVETKHFAMCITHYCESVKDITIKVIKIYTALFIEVTQATDRCDYTCSTHIYSTLPSNSEAV